MGFSFGGGEYYSRWVTCTPYLLIQLLGNGEEEWSARNIFVRESYRKEAKGVDNAMLPGIYDEFSPTKDCVSQGTDTVESATATVVTTLALLRQTNINIYRLYSSIYIYIQTNINIYIIYIYIVSMLYI